MNIKSIKFDVLIKFIEEKYIYETLDNGIYFNRLNIFKESDGLTEEQLDSDEGALVDFSIPEKLELFDKNHNKITDIDPKLISDFKIKRSFDFVKDIPVACFSLLRFPYDFQFVKIKKSIYEFKIKNKIVYDLKSISGDRPFIWIWEQDLIKCLNSEIKLERKILAKKIKYYKPKGKNITENSLKENPFKVIFMKNEVYKKQKEFRIALLDKKENGYYKIPNLKIEKGTNLEDFRLYINKKFDGNNVAIKMSEENEEIFENFPEFVEV
jgi:hypothetical protein